MKRKIYVVGNSTDYANWMQGKLTKDLEKADLVCFTGGEDVSPNLYGEPKHYTTGCNPDRDQYESQIFKQALALKKPMIGICRGSQFLCVMNGGKLVQHQENKFSMHKFMTIEPSSTAGIENAITEYEITSTHHQAQYPWNLKEKDYVVLGWTENLSKFHLNGEGKEIVNGIVPFNQECENVYYPKTKCLGIQGHPEWMSEIHPTVKYLQNQLDKLINNKLLY